MEYEPEEGPQEDSPDEVQDKAIGRSYSGAITLFWIAGFGMAPLWSGLYASITIDRGDLGLLIFGVGPLLAVLCSVTVPIGLLSAIVYSRTKGAPLRRFAMSALPAAVGCVGIFSVLNLLRH
jgi:hypothetical protein